MTVTQERRRSTARGGGAPGGRVVASRVEPRIVERRRRVAEETATRRRRVWLAAAAVVALAAAAVGSLFTPLFDVDRIEVRGADRIAEERLLAVAGISRGDQLVQVDLDGARDALRALPEVRSAGVSLEWPSGVRIVVTEEVPLATVRLGGAELVVSHTGRILDPESVPATAPLPSLDVDALAGSGPGSTSPGALVPDELVEAVRVFDRMGDALRAQVPGARMDAAGSVELDLAAGGVIRLGPLEDLPAKLDAAEAVLGQVARDCLAVIDVREPARATVARTGACSGAADGGVDG